MQSLDATTRRKHGHLGLCTRPTIARFYGEERASVLERLPINQVSDPIPSGGGWVLLKVAEVQSSYEQLKGEVEDLVVASHCTALMRDLMAQTTIRSRYLPSTVFAAPPAPSSSPASQPKP